MSKEPIPKYQYRKLVRDSIPDWIEHGGEKPIVKILDTESADFRHVLLQKFIEEISEFVKNPSAEEEADVQELFRKARKVFGYNEADVEKERAFKAEAFGTFEEGVYLIGVEPDESVFARRVTSLARTLRGGSNAAPAGTHEAEGQQADPNGQSQVDNANDQAEVVGVVLQIEHGNQGN